MDILEAVIYADDLVAAEEFYNKLLVRQPLIKDEGKHIFYRLQSSMLLIFNAEQSSVQCVSDKHPIPAHGAKGPGHVCLSMMGIEPAVWRKRLAELDIELEQDITWPNDGVSLYFRDPAGNSIEIATPKMWGF
ncbi:hypothetical protein [Persicirhabdus sediminis]|uniref:VOC domain-containing protein n=1 Tax=Persicirhabdus sediminis TaxID=454144 RepID=A0A8J7MA71_9BACT|nr:hypothetical protein [Persicirhabdus sediminis]MBK1789737.1 hypothetical protein [Persicirhabdus sediminis]